MDATQVVRYPEADVDLRLVHAAVVEDKAGVCKRQARLLGLQVELHDLMVTCKIRSRTKLHQLADGVWNPGKRG